MTYKIRTVVLGMAMLLGALSIASAGVAAYVARYMHSFSRDVAMTLSGVRSAAELQKYLRAYSRQRYMSEVWEGGRYLDRRASSENEVWHALDIVGARISGADEAKLVEELKAEIQEFFGADELRQRSQSPLVRFRAESQATRSIEDKIERLVDLKHEEAEGVQSAMAGGDGLVTRFAIVSVVLVVVFCTALMLWLRLSFYRPIVSLCSAMAEFGKEGRKNAKKMTPRGPAEVRELASRFEEMTSSLEGRRETQLRFLSAVAHDLRNPLSGIRMASALLSSDDLSREDQRTYADIVGRQAGYLDRLVGDLLDTTRIEAGQLELRFAEVDLRALAEETIRLYQATTTVHRLKLREGEGSLSAVCDGTRIGQVLNNLVSNGIKYSPYGGVIEIDVCRDHDEAIISITDEGMGIAVDDLRRIFEPFRRSDSTRDIVPGVGLGLSVARRIVEAHGGTIEVESVIGRGTRFRVRFPVKGVAVGNLHAVPQTRAARSSTPESQAPLH